MAASWSPTHSHTHTHTHTPSTIVDDPCSAFTSAFTSADPHSTTTLALQSADRPLSGPGTSRQTRRLQLRNAGFQGPSMASARVTPQAISDARGQPTSPSDTMQNSSDAENWPLAASKSSSRSPNKRRSSSILQELNNKKTSNRASIPAFANMRSADDSSSPPPTKTSTIRARTIKSRAKVHRARRSISAETTKYIDHLEAELASAQTQLSTREYSPTNSSREQSARMRSLAGELRQMQQEVSEWESKYESRVQEVENTHAEIEVGLRAHIRALEKNKDETAYRIQELEHQLTTTADTADAVEAANVNLERRLEIMSELLASSPTKLPLHPITPGSRKRQSRPMSLVARLSNAGSLGTSPERTSQSRPASPAVFRLMSPRIQPARPQLGLDTNVAPSDLSSDAASVFSEAHMSAVDSITSIDQSDCPLSLNAWGSNAIPSARPRTTRRMRKFGGGSVGPKPLILPATNNFEGVPFSAPPVERAEMTPAYRFPRPISALDHPRSEAPSSTRARRRASTTGDVSSLKDFRTSQAWAMNQSDSNESNESSPEQDSDPLSPHARSPSFESAGGRNLMDELSAARSSDGSDSSKRYSIISDDGSLPYIPLDSPIRLFNAKSTDEDPTLMPESPSDDYDEEQATPTNKSTSRGHSREVSGATSVGIGHTPSAWDRLRALFGPLLQSPVDVARHLIVTAQNKMRIPEPLRNVQWWLVGVLLGPMAKRRLLRRPPSRLHPSTPPPPPVDPHTPLQNEPDTGGGTSSSRPPTSSQSKPTSLTERRRKRHSSSPSGHWSKHSPWLWLKFSITLAFAVGVAFKDGPGSLMKATTACVYNNTHRVRSSPPSRGLGVEDGDEADGEETDA